MAHVAVRICASQPTIGGALTTLHSPLRIGLIPDVDDDCMDEQKWCSCSW